LGNKVSEPAHSIAVFRIPELRIVAIVRVTVTVLLR